jgi:hypothetical protein
VTIQDTKRVLTARAPQLLIYFLPSVKGVITSKEAVVAFQIKLTL